MGQSGKNLLQAFQSRGNFNTSLPGNHICEVSQCWRSSSFLELYGISPSSDTGLWFILAATETCKMYHPNTIRRTVGGGIFRVDVELCFYAHSKNK